MQEACFKIVYEFLRMREVLNEVILKMNISASYSASASF